MCNSSLQSKQKLKPISKWQVTKQFILAKLYPLFSDIEISLLYYLARRKVKLAVCELLFEVRVDAFFIKKIELDIVFILTHSQKLVNFIDSFYSIQYLQFMVIKLFECLLVLRPIFIKSHPLLKVFLLVILLQWWIIVACHMCHMIQLYIIIFV